MKHFSISLVPVCLLLFAAAMLKTWQLAVSPAEANYIFDSRLLTLLLIEFELFLSLWLISGIRYLSARRLCLALFVLFSIVSFAKAMGGETNCGCLGVIQVHPWFMFVVDVLAAGLLAWSIRSAARPSADSGARDPATRPLVTVGALLMIAVLVPIFSLKTTTVSDAGDILGDDGLVIIEPENWIGKPFPLTNFINDAEPILDGDWRVVLYHEDCPVCQRHIRAAGDNENHPATVFVEVPPYRSPRRATRPNLLWRKLDKTRDWFVEAPATIVLQQGIVREFIPRTETH